MGTARTFIVGSLGLSSWAAFLLCGCASAVSGVVCDPDCPGDQMTPVDTVDTSDPNQMQLYLLDESTAPGAVCLDGSPGGFYYRPALSPEHSTDWVLHFKGAGWCYDEVDCLGRATIQNGGQFGSSKSWPNISDGWSSGILSASCDENPDFCDYNKVILLYCDGLSFSGDRTDPITVQGTPVHFAGKRIMDGILSQLLTSKTFGLDKATNVLLTGCSSGALAAYLHANHVQNTIAASAPDMVKFRVAPDSGFFLYHKNIVGVPVYPDQIQEMFKLSNASGGVNQKCITATTDPDEHYRCMFAQFVVGDIDAPTMILNSALDAWQTSCIFTAALPTDFPNQSSLGTNGQCNAFADFRNCSGNPNNCNTTQMETMNGYQKDFVAAIQGSAAYTKAGNGVFAHSCHTHCEALAAGWHYNISGVTMQAAVSKWWHAATAEPAVDNRHLPCVYHTTTSPHTCNPSCPG